MSEHLKLNNYERPKLDLPGEDNSLLLHSCCAPCAGEVMEAVAASDIKTTVYFYNPNIHPLAEYEIRKDENNHYTWFQDGQINLYENCITKNLKKKKKKKKKNY